MSAETENSTSDPALEGPMPVWRKTRPLISIVAPCFNEVDAIRLFEDAIFKTLLRTGCPHELVLVDDGSTDGTREELIRLAASKDNVRSVILSRNFGKEAALTAGLDYVTGDVVVVMDVDLQDPPDLILDFLAKWREGFDVVYGKREDRRTDSFAKRVTAGGFYRLFNKISGLQIPDNAGDYRLMDRKVVEAVKALPERSRFMKGLFAWVGFRTTGVPYARPARAAGVSKFNYWKLWNFALDGFVSFSTAPLRVWSYLGGAVAALSFIYASFIVLRTAITGIDVPGYASLLTFVLFLGGVQIASVGVLGEYISRLFVEVKQRPLYVVDEIVAFEPHSLVAPEEMIAPAQATDEGPRTASAG